MMTKTAPLFVAILGLALAACGDHQAQPDAAGAPVDAPAGPPRAVVVAGDFTAGHPGVLSTLDPAARTVMTNVGPAMAVGNDPILRHFGNELLIINRSENNITILDDQTLQFKEQIGTGAGTDPQDVAVLGQKLYVPSFESKGVTVLTRGSTATTEIDLSADDPDGKPNCTSAYLVGADLYVSCGLLDSNFQPRGPGKVYVVDTATSMVKTTLTLSSKNPIGLFERIPEAAPHNAGELVMPTALFPSFPSTDLPIGCLERIIPGAAPTAPGCLFNNTDLGGYVGRVAFQIDQDSSIMWVVVPVDITHGSLHAYDMPSSALWAGPLSPSSEVIGDAASCPSGQVVVTDTTKDANGLRVYNNGAEPMVAPLAVGLPPVSSHGLVCY